MLSAVKKAEDRDSVIIRIYNPTENEVSGKIKIGFEFKQVFLINLNEERLKAVEGKSSISITAGKGRIISLELEL